MRKQKSSFFIPEKSLEKLIISKNFYTKTKLEERDLFHQDEWCWKVFFRMRTSTASGKKTCFWYRAILILCKLELRQLETMWYKIKVSFHARNGKNTNYEIASKFIKNLSFFSFSFLSSSSSSSSFLRISVAKLVCMIFISQVYVITIVVLLWADK